MSDYIYPEVTPNQSSLELVSNTDARVSPLSGAVQTVDRTGERLMMTLSHQNLQDADRRKLLSFLALLNGMQHRAYIRDFSYSGPTGSLTVANLNPELVVANYSAVSWQNKVDVTGGIRIRRRGEDVLGAYNKPSVAPTVAAGASYSLKNAIIAYENFQPYGSPLYVMDPGETFGGIFASGAQNMATGVYAVGFTAPNTTIHAGVFDNALAGRPDEQYDWHRSELARCLLIDNGVNELTYSEQFDNAAWSKATLTVSADPSPGNRAPDASSTADKLIAASSSPSQVQHYINQTVTVAASASFWTGSVFIKAAELDRIYFAVSDVGAPNSSGFAYFDATNGVVSSTPGTGGNGESVYASIHAYPNDWYRCRISVRLPGATTSARLSIYLCAPGTNSATFAGEDTVGILAWGAQLQQGGQLGRYVETTTAAATADSQTGSEIWVKGLDADTDGQLLAGDQVQIGDQLCILESDLDGDESGVGLATVYPRIRTAPADEDAVVLYRPTGKFILSEQRNGMANRPGVFSDISLQFMEDIAS